MHTATLLRVSIAILSTGCAELEAAPSPPLQARGPNDEPIANVADADDLARGVASLMPLGGTGARGTVALTQTPDGVVVDATIRGLDRGRHVLQVHAADECDVDDEGGELGRVGALGIVQPDIDGVARLHAIVPGLTLDGGLPGSLPGRTLSVQPSPETAPGDPEVSDAAVACGVIRRARPTS
jgi:Cu-Zn family superoxide dismutase